MINKFLYCCFFFFLGNLLHAQVNWTQEYTSTNDARVIRYSNHDQSTWIGTFGGGLVQVMVDGKVIRYTNINSEIVQNKVIDIDIDHQGVVYVGFYNGEVMAFDGAKWESVYSYSAYVNDIHIDSKGALLVGTSRSIVKIENGIETNFPIPDNDVNAIAEDSDGFYWFGTSDKGLVQFKDTVVNIYNEDNSEIPNDEIDEIVFDNNGVMWLGVSSRGLVRFDGETWTNWNTFNSDIPASNLNELFVDDNNDIWIATYGLCKFDGNNFINYDTATSNYPGEWTNSVIVDPSGKVWAGNQYYGTYTFSNGVWEKFEIPSSYLPANGATMMAESPDGKKWFGLNSSYYGLAMQEGGTWTYFGRNEESPFNSNHCWQIDFDSQGNTWFATWDGLYQLDASFNWTVYNEFNSDIPSNNIHYLAVDDSDKLWMASNDEIYTFKEGDWNTHKVSGAGSFNEIKFDSKGYAWISSGSNGLYRFRGSSYDNYNTSNSDIHNDNMYTVTIDSADNIYVGGSGGFSKFGSSSWESYTIFNSPLPHHYVRDLEIGPKGNLWISLANYGLTKYDFNDEWMTETYSNSPLESIFVNSVSIDGNGTIWVANEGFLSLEEDLVTSLNTIEKAKVTLYPNPFNESAHLLTNFNYNTDYELNIYSISGQLLRSTIGKTTRNIEIHKNTLDSGIYIYSLLESGNTHTGKLIIE